MEEATTPSRKRRLIWLLLAAGLVLGLLIAVAAASRDVYVSDPARERPWARTNYLDLVGTSKLAPPPDPNLLSKLVITQAIETLEIHGFPPQRLNDTLIGQQMLRIPPGKPYKFPGGELRLESQGIVYGVPEGQEVSRSHIPLPVRYYLPDGTPVKEPESKEVAVPGYRTLDYNGWFPRVLFTFTTPANSEWKVLGCRLFDARTKVNLGEFLTHRQIDNRLVIETLVNRINNGPLELVVDFAHGPAVLEKITPTAGEVIDAGDWQLHLASVLSGTAHQWPNQTNIVFSTRFSPREKTTFVFLGTPWSDGLPVEFYTKSKSGKRDYPYAGNSSWGSLPVYSNLTVDDIDTLLVRYYPEVRRLIFELPDLHGMPEAEEVDNLFDQPIEEVWFNKGIEVDDFIEWVTQLKFRGTLPDAPYAGKNFPLSIKNTTARQLLEQHLEQIDEEYGSVIVDEEAGEIVVSPTLKERVMNRIKGLLR